MVLTRPHLCFVLLCSLVSSAAGGQEPLLAHVSTSAVAPVLEGPPTLLGRQASAPQAAPNSSPPPGPQAWNEDAVLSADGPLLLGEERAFSLRSKRDSGAAYLAACSLGVEPGIATPAGRLGLAFDALLLSSLTGGPSFVDFQGSLDASGSASFALAIPPAPGLLGASIATAALVLDPQPQASGGIRRISNTLVRRVRLSDPQYDFTQVDALLEQASDDWVFGRRGIAFAFVQNGELVHASGVGGFTPATRVRLGSGTKWWSATALMTLVDDERVALDDPLSSELPFFFGPKRAITYRQAFSHTSGIDPGASCLSDTSTTLEDCARAIAFTPLDTAPGSTFAYGGASMQCAGAAMETLVADPFGRWVQRAVAAPIQARSFAYDGLGRTANPRVGGGGKCNARDYARLLIAMLDGGAVDGTSLLSTDAVLTLLGDQIGGASFAPTQQTNAVGYGLGVWRDRVDANGYAVEVSSPGAFGCYPWIDRELGYGAIVLIDRRLSDGIELVELLRPLLEREARKG